MFSLADAEDANWEFDGFRIPERWRFKSKFALTQSAAGDENGSRSFLSHKGDEVKGSITNWRMHNRRGGKKWDRYLELLSNGLDWVF
jgi:hypothetical protein